MHVLLNEYAAFSSCVQMKDEEREIHRAHAFLFQEALSGTVRFVHRCQSRLLGFSFLTVIDDCVYYDATIHCHEKNLLRFLHWQILNETIRNFPSVRFLIHQGSESSGQDWWKRSWKPIQSIEKTHLIF